MTTYIYETIPQVEGEEPEVFEFRQRMTDAPLKQHPENGKPVRRIISGGLGMISKGKASAPKPAGGCGHSCGCHH